MNINFTNSTSPPIFHFAFLLIKEELNEKKTIKKTLKKWRVKSVPSVKLNNTSTIFTTIIQNVKIVIAKED